ncbi:MAG: NUDIX domain-containing protein [Pseudomonadota bacterium]
MTDDRSAAQTPTKHRNDTYGEVGRAASADGGPEPIPAATVVLLRDGDAGAEVLMLHKTSKISFGGMWVFPGGRIDAADYDAEGDVDTAARRAAARESKEEASIDISPDDFVWFAHWTPPGSSPKRFATWFFATGAAHLDRIAVDGGEIDDHRWIRPRDALARQAEGEIDLAPPTWVTLYQLARQERAADVLSALASQPPRYYETRVAARGDGVRVALWEGDAGYADWDADAAGPRHRLTMAAQGFEFSHDGVDYP